MITSVTFKHTQYAPPPHKFEAGTGHIAGAVGLAASVNYIESIGPDAAQAHEAALVAYARRRLADDVPGLRLLGPPDGVGVTAFALAGIAVRAGHHCAQPTLRHYGLTAAVRPSFALYDTREEIDLLVAELNQMQRRSKTASGAPPTMRQATTGGSDPPDEQKDHPHRM